MMNMERLKFAFARGARIQEAYCAYPDLPVQWHIIDSIPTVPRPLHIYRVYPPDSHLEYGPLTSAIRQEVMYADEPMSEENNLYLATYHFMLTHCLPQSEYEELMKIVRSGDYDFTGCFGLYMAEFFADEGL